MSFETIDELVAAYLKARETDWYWWAAQDRPILTLCQESPHHTDVLVNFAKVSLVNRVYRAHLQTGAKLAEWRVAEVLASEEVDTVLEPLRSHSAFDGSTSAVVRDAHRALVTLIHDKVTNQINNSFVSKYLSFHFPNTVPLFDTYAYKSAWKLAGRPLRHLDYEHLLNKEYAYHCAAVELLVSRLRKAGCVDVQLKLLDHLLYDQNRNDDE